MASKNKLLGSGVPEEQPVKNERQIRYPCWVVHDTQGSRIVNSEEEELLLRTDGWYRRSERLSISAKATVQKGIKSVGGLSKALKE